jgi:hypothetical protein
MSIFKDGSNRRGDHLLSKKKAVESPSNRVKVSNRPVVGGRGKAKVDTSKLSVLQTVNMLIDQINDDVDADEKKAAEKSSSGFFGDRIVSLVFTGTVVTSIIGMLGFYVVPEKVVGKFGEEYEIFGHGIETAGYSLSYPSVADANDMSGGIVKVVTNDIARESQDVIVNTGGDMKFQSFTFPTALMSDTYRDLKKESMVYDHQSLEAASFVPKANIVYRSFVAKRDMDYREVLTALTTNDPVASNIAVSTINGLIIFNSYGERSDLAPRTRERPKKIEDIANEWKVEMGSFYSIFSALTYGPAVFAKAAGWTGDGPNFFFENHRLNRNAILKEGQRVVISADNESVTFFFPHFK